MLYIITCQKGGPAIIPTLSRTLFCYGSNGRPIEGKILLRRIIPKIRMNRDFIFRHVDREVWERTAQRLQARKSKHATPKTLAVGISCRLSQRLTRWTSSSSRNNGRNSSSCGCFCRDRENAGPQHGGIRLLSLGLYGSVIQRRVAHSDAAREKDTCRGRWLVLRLVLGAAAVYAVGGPTNAHTATWDVLA